MKHYKTEYNPVTGAREDYYFDDVEDKMIIRRRQDVTDIVEANKRKIANSVDSRYGNEMLHHVADIPIELAYKWKREEGLDVLSNDPEMKRRLRRKLNDPEFRWLKTTVKRL